MDEVVSIQSQEARAQVRVNRGLGHPDGCGNPEHPRGKPKHRIAIPAYGAASSILTTRSPATFFRL